MSTLEFQPAAGDWTVIPVEPEQIQWFANLLRTREFSGHSALGILAAGQAYFNARPSLQETTLIRNHDEFLWPKATAQLAEVASSFGFSLRLEPIEQLVQKGGYVLLESSLPPPSEVMALPGLAFLRRNLAYYASKGSPHPHGFKYVGFTRHNINDTLQLGYADPGAGIRSEITLELGPLKEQYGFPPPPLKLPEQWGPPL